MMQGDARSDRQVQQYTVAACGIERWAVAILVTIIDARRLLLIVAAANIVEGAQTWPLRTGLLW
jgi:hypothetical protein